MAERKLDTHYRCLEAMYRGAPVNNTIPSRVEVSDGRAEITMEVSEAYWHAAGAMHGSMYFKALDDACFFAANSVITDIFVLTARFEVQLLAPVTSTKLRAIGRIESRDGTKLETSSVLYVGDQIVARGRGLFIAGGSPLSEVPAYLQRLEKEQ